MLHAWSGLLDPEELFIINKGFEKVEADLLPVTQEDLCTRRYADSESTLDSDDFSLDSNQSTEVDLFEEIRASIEKSNIMSNICKSVCKSGVGEAHKRETHCKYIANSEQILLWMEEEIFACSFCMWIAMWLHLRYPKEI